jgi:hypothetical protein
MNNKGILLIKVPNHTRETLITNHMLPEHVFNFDLNSLKYLLNRCGFKTVETIYGRDNELPTLTVLATKIR